LPEERVALPATNEGKASMPFQDRADAGRRLAQAIQKYRDTDAVVLALPRGGVPVAKEVAAAIHAPLDLVMVRKIGVPSQPELAMGAVVDGAHPLTVRNDEVIAMARVRPADFDAIRDRELKEIRRRRAVYIGDRPHPALEGRTAIVVDDGVATGATMRAALQSVRRQKPKKLVLAIPVAPADTLDDLRHEADEVICIESHDTFGALGAYYADFRQVSDAEVEAILADSPI
jgi:predicted phosphoribosyltransferase